MSPPPAKTLRNSLSGMEAMSESIVERRLDAEVRAFCVRSIASCGRNALRFVVL